ncbi:glycosyltransferase family 4 protein [Roseibium sp.]|uniref:glycosyltransferase family 4 protein n=1 Tax=Roseibium sp. TaxID=1936156 RepID=UPI003B522D6E
MVLPVFYFAYPGDLNTLTGGYGYDRQILAGLNSNGWDVHPISLGSGFPFPNEKTLQYAEGSLASLPTRSVVIIDGLAFGVLGDVAQRLAEKLTILALVHHPLCKENGLSEDEVQNLHASEASALSQARHIIVTSPATADQLKDLFDVPSEKISVALPGTERPKAKDRAPSKTVRLLSIGTVTQRKGYDLLFSALAGLKEHDWHLDIIGGLEADPECVRALNAQADDLRLADRLTFHGAVPYDRLSDFYQAADVFVLASRYEGYGMAYTEAIAHGLPVIGSGAGAVVDTLSDGGALYCGVEDVPALKAALERLLTDPGARQKLAQEAQVAAQSLPTWGDAVTVFETVVEKVRS